jgi:hypothetical protein
MAKTNNSKATTDSASVAADQKVTEADAKRILAEFKRRPALMKKKLVFKLDAAIREDNFGVARRMAFLFLTKTGAALINQVKKDREFAVAIADAQTGIHSYADNLRNLLSWVEEADRRCLVALAIRPDMHSVRAEVAHG